MNARTTFTRPVRTDDVFWTVGERAHRHAISTHLPNMDELEMATRVALAQLRDEATAACSRATDGAAAIALEVSRLATAAVFAPAPIGSLMHLRSALALTMLAAQEVDRAQRNG